MAEDPSPQPDDELQPDDQQGIRSQLVRRFDLALKALEPWTRRLNTLAGFLAALGAVALAVGAIGLRSCIFPEPSPTASVGPGGSGAAESNSTSFGPTDTLDPSPTADPTATPVPTPAPVPPAGYFLRWVESPSSDSAVLDGNVRKAGSKIWMQELYPATAPTRFDVEAVLDPVLATALEGVITGPGFAVKAKDFAAYSDRPWILPEPPPSSGSISYRFRDNADRRSGPVTVATYATMELALEPGAAGEPPTKTVNIDEDLRIEADVSFEQGADVGVVLLTPWESGSDGLTDYVRAYYGEVTRNPEQAEAATERFLSQYAGALPQSRPAGWQFSAEPGAMTGKAGSGTSFALTGTLPSSAATLFAIKLVDRSDPTRVAVSDIFRIEAVGPDVAPTVNVLSPEGFAQGTSHLLKASDGLLFTDIQLQANVVDADGPIPDDAIVWATDRGDLQPNGPELGRGEFQIARLYADSCPGAVHVVTLTVDDQTGHIVRETGTVTLSCDVS